jgi:hypothetical protein
MDENPSRQDRQSPPERLLSQSRHARVAYPHEQPLAQSLSLHLLQSLTYLFFSSIPAPIIVLRAVVVLFVETVGEEVALHGAPIRAADLQEQGTFAGEEAGSSAS